jgi:tRNA G18 (ribose-2'-O)-methylase SpoU
MGGHLHIPIHFNLSYDQIKEMIGKKTKIMVADSNDDVQGRTTSCYDSLLLKEKIETDNERVALIIGNEVRGISEDAYNLALGLNKNDPNKIIKLKVPLSNQVESLNCAIAFAIIGYQLKHLIDTKQILC